MEKTHKYTYDCLDFLHPLPYCIKSVPQPPLKPNLCRNSKKLGTGTPAKDLNEYCPRSKLIEYQMTSQKEPIIILKIIPYKKN